MLHCNFPVLHHKLATHSDELTQGQEATTGEGGTISLQAPVHCTVQCKVHAFTMLGMRGRLACLPPAPAPAPRPAPRPAGGRGRVDHIMRRGGVALAGMGFLGESLAQLLLVLVSVGGCYSLLVNVSEVTSFTKLRSWKQSTLYRVEAEAGYQSNPLLLQVVGSRYGELPPRAPANVH